MKKIILVLLTTLCLFAILPACGSSKDNGTGEATFTGVIDEKKDFMIIVNSEDGKNAYIFNLDGITCEPNEGDKVTVTYTGGELDDIDATLVATKIEKVQ